MDKGKRSTTSRQAPWADAVIGLPANHIVNHRRQRRQIENGHSQPVLDLRGEGRHIRAFQNQSADIPVVIDQPRRRTDNLGPQFPDVHVVTPRLQNDLTELGRALHAANGNGNAAGAHGGEVLIRQVARVGGQDSDTPSGREHRLGERQLYQA